MVALTPTAIANIVNEQVYCDNFGATCDNWTDRTFIQARVKGWHIFEGKTQGGTQVTWILCPACVGQRGQRLRAPQVLEGQEELF